MDNLKEMLNNNYLSSLEALDLSIKRKLENTSFSGAKKSNAKGNSMEFSDFREYAAGDDLRRVDWNSFARTDKMYLKLFMEEKQATVNIFFDNSRSMGVYSDKRLFSGMLAASISYIALKNTDKVNIFAFNEAVNSKNINNVSKKVFINIVNFLESLEYSAQTNICNSVSKLEDRLLGNGISIIISDFFLEDGYEEAVKRLLYKKQDVILIQVLAGEQQSHSLNGPVRLIDSENSQALDLELNEDILKEYAKALKKYQNEIKEFCYRRGIRFISVTPKDDIFKVISSVLY